MTYLVPLALFVGFVISLVMVALLVRAGRRAGMLDSSGSEGHHKQLRSIPNIGGIGIFLGAVVPLGIGLGLLSLSESVWSLLPGSIRPPDDLVAQSLPTWVAIVAAALVLHVVGLVDDRRPLGAGLKLLVQAVMAASLVLLFDVRFLHVLDDFGGIGWSISVVGTILWILVITNAINFLDNMDGLAAGVAVVASTIMMIATLMNAQWFIALSLALLIGSLLGFLVFNFPVARIFMGDGGSLVVGWLLAIATVRITFVDTGDPDYALGSAWYGVLMPLVVLAVPLYDFTSVVVIRTLQGRSPFVGDQQHFSHRLVARGLSSTRAVLVIWLVAIVTGVGGIFLGSVAPWIAILIGVQTLLLLCMLAVLEHGTRSEGGRG
ncbi:MAG: undecaprenyl/decaprenyl-phosphate alpha-N-acetylglucosaminyl 1-phosphate transferase [Phycisphaerales bacterium]|nr:undecaprenyl/decaprenyl-phosphate alpha-N-acetylglucosaminyl 1-phosphate transferase [Phycisphaerales bacterium]